ncbi:LacI family DNA-binding transcriptional regulator [Flavobacterium antarcticum]|uniref:LacI family DNA-binding transcriptional regulator n=1 Tax=Flavobacterium antarcticum TaxID=271155 RepID=UPI0003B3046D|nr:LacI family DNA-binding transcriptional regulator [Flavobacterium antarcticum]
MKEKATLKQIAKQLGVSVSTVSKALNNSPEISDTTKAKIQEFAKLKNYKPNVTALNLKNRQTKTIGVILPNMLNSFFAKVFTGIEKVAEEKGYHIITCISNESLEKEINAMELLSNGTVDGFILSISEQSQKEQYFEHFIDCINDGVPIVMFDRVTDQVKCDKVIVDDLDSAFDATQHLINLGCKKIALLSTIDNLSVGQLRAKGYYKALEENKYLIDENLIILTEASDEFDTKLEALIATQKIDGIFALDEHSSVSSLKLALQNEYKIPEDLSIIGFADGVWSRRLTPSLSTVSQHGPEIGETAARLLIEKLENKGTETALETTVIKTELRQRGSTRKLLNQ